MVIQEKRYSVDELWQLSHSRAYSGRRLELIEGVLYEMAPAGWKHGNIASELDMRLRLHAKEHGLGQVTAAETGYRLTENTVIAPDVGFIARERIPDEIPEGYVPFAPDLAVEVMSPGNTASEMREKVELLLQHGTRLIWIVYPDQKKIDVYQPASGGAQVVFLDQSDTLDGGEVLPGFQLKLSELFAV